jgi:hypothetical protein
MMIKQIVGKCFIFAGVFLLACAIMGGGQADAGCSDTVCSGNCPGLLAPNCGMGRCTGGMSPVGVVPASLDLKWAVVLLGAYAISNTARVPRVQIC